MTEPSTNRLEIVAESWRDDPNAWALQALAPSDRPHGWQREFLERLRDSKVHKVAVRGARGCGKSTVLAMAALWRATTIPGSLTVLCASVSRQLTVGVWNEIRRLWRGSDILRRLYPGWEILSDRIETGDPAWRVLTLSSDSVYNVEGAHGQHVAVLIDEARALDDRFYFSLRALLTGEDHLLVAAGTAGRPLGWWFRAWARDGRDLFDFYQTVTADEMPGLRCRMEEEARLLGVSDPIFRMEWLAEFSESVQDSLFSLAAIEKCFGLDPGAPVLEPRPIPPPLVFGCDLALTGDTSVVCLLRDRKVDGFIELPPSRELMETTGRIAALARQMGPVKIVVDEIGLGSGVRSRLAEVFVNAPVQVLGFNAAERANDPERYFNTKTELVVDLKGAMEAGEIGLPRNDRLIREMLSVSTRITSSGKLKLEDPSNGSPDYFDAMLCALSSTFLHPSIGVEHVDWI